MGAGHSSGEILMNFSGSEVDSWSFVHFILKEAVDASKNPCEPSKLKSPASRKDQRTHHLKKLFD